MKGKISSKINLLGVSTFDLFQISERLKREGKDVINLDLGEPDFDTPNFIKEKAYEALKMGLVHYTLPQGIVELREKISDYEKRRYGINIPPENIVVTPGAKAMILYALQAIVDINEEVLYPDPGYLTYPTLIRLSGGSPVPYKMITEKGFEPDFVDIQTKINPKTKAIIVNFPHNPTGAIITKDVLERFYRISKENEIFILSDEIYSRLVYDGEKHETFYHYYTEDGLVIIIEGFSKAFAMTGWRLGYGALPKFLVGPVTKFVANTVSCAVSFVQYAALSALEENADLSVEEMKKIFEKRKKMAYQILKDSGIFEVNEPKGAFYIFPKYLTPQGVSSYEVCKYLLERKHVSCVPGSFFGENGEGYIRISIAQREDKLEEGLIRVIEGLKNFQALG